MLTKKQLTNLVSNYLNQIDRMSNNNVEHKNLAKLLSDMTSYDIITINEEDAILETLETYAIDHFNYFGQCFSFGNIEEESDKVANDIISNAEFLAIL